MHSLEWANLHLILENKCPIATAHLSQTPAAQRAVWGRGSITSPTLQKCWSEDISLQTHRLLPARCSRASLSDGKQEVVEDMDWQLAEGEVLASLKVAQMLKQRLNKKNKSGRSEASLPMIYAEGVSHCEAPSPSSRAYHTPSLHALFSNEATDLLVVLKMLPRNEHRLFPPPQMLAVILMLTIVGSYYF